MRKKHFDDWKRETSRKIIIAVAVGVFVCLCRLRL